MNELTKDAAYAATLPGKQAEIPSALQSTNLQHAGYTLIDWMTTRVSSLNLSPVHAPTHSGGVLCTRRTLPQQPDSLQSILSDVEQMVFSAMMPRASEHQTLPVHKTGSEELVAALLASIATTAQRLWNGSAPSGDVETVAVEWCRQMFGLPSELAGSIHQNAGLLPALTLARDAALGRSIRQKGLAGRADVPRLRIYASQEAHPSLLEAVAVIGIGQESVRLLETDEQFRLEPQAVEQALQEDLAQGWLPCAIVATIGTRVTGSSDPIPELADLCERFGLWLHVDATCAGGISLLPEFRWLLAGCERADTLSLCLSPWLFSTEVTTLLYARRPATFQKMVQAVGEPVSQDEAAHAFVDAYAGSTSSLALWILLRVVGQEALVKRVRKQYLLAHLFARWIERTPEVEHLTPSVLGRICFRFHPAALQIEEKIEVLNERILLRMRQSGQMLLSAVRVRGQFALHLSLGDLRTTTYALKLLWQALQQTAEEERERVLQEVQV